MSESPSQPLSSADTWNPADIPGGVKEAMDYGYSFKSIEPDLPNLIEKCKDPAFARKMMEYLFTEGLRSGKRHRLGLEYIAERAKELEIDRGIVESVGDEFLRNAINKAYKS